MACRGLPASVEVHLLGKVAPADVPRIYADSCFDVFLNVSESEGVPVSIMEAMGAGIPAIVTEVGGNGEIVDDTVGVVVGKNVSGRALAQVIAKLRQIPCNQQLAMREACRHRVQDDYDLSRNARAVAETLWSLSEEGRNPVSDRSTE
jgi:glycosyltransferase involved in cell wall biosynthesis